MKEHQQYLILIKILKAVMNSPHLISVVYKLCLKILNNLQFTALNEV